VTGNNIEVIIEKCKKLINEKGIKVIIIDYIQLINSLSKEDNRDVEITKIMTKLKQLAVNTGVVVIILSQLSKAVDARMSMGGEGPMLCDFRESESFFNIPDKVLCNRSRKY
jgi:replicative DNA helicase